MSVEPPSLQPTPSSVQTVSSISSWGDIFRKLEICSIFSFLRHFDV